MKDGVIFKSMKGGNKMKKFISITIVMMFTVGLVAIGSTNADAMNNEAAALLTAGIVLFSIPVMSAIAQGGTYAEPAYAYTRAPRHIEKTKIIYVQARHKKHRRDWARPYERGYRKEWKRLQYRRGLHDARHDFRRGRDYAY